MSGRRIVKENLTYTVSEHVSARFLGYNNGHAIWIIDIKWHILIKKSKLSEPLTGAFPVAGGNMGTKCSYEQKSGGASVV